MAICICRHIDLIRLLLAQDDFSRRARRRDRCCVGAMAGGRRSTKPEAWLLHAARNRIIDAARRHQVRQNAETFLRQIAEEAQTVAVTHEQFPDERLKLLFVCAHPAIDPLRAHRRSWQTVLGVDAARIASAFLVSPAAMSQRLVRAKTKIRETRPFRSAFPSPRSARNAARGRAGAGTVAVRYGGIRQFPRVTTSMPMRLFLPNTLDNDHI